MPVFEPHRLPMPRLRVATRHPRVAAWRLRGGMGEKRPARSLAASAIPACFLGDDTHTVSPPLPEGKFGNRHKRVFRCCGRVVDTAQPHPSIVTEKRRLDAYPDSELRSEHFIVKHPFAISVIILGKQILIVICRQFVIELNHRVVV